MTGAVGSLCKLLKLGRTQLHRLLRARRKGTPAKASDLGSLVKVKSLGFYSTRTSCLLQTGNSFKTKSNVLRRSLGVEPGGSGLRDRNTSPLTYIHTHSHTLAFACSLALSLALALFAQCQSGQGLSWRGGCAQLGQRVRAEDSEGWFLQGHRDQAGPHRGSTGHQGIRLGHLAKTFSSCDLYRAACSDTGLLAFLHSSHS